MKRLISIITLLGLTLSLATGQASANVTYTFSGATFFGGGTLTGTFTTNDAITAMTVDFDITTSSAPSFGLDGFHYTPATSSFSNGLPFSLTSPVAITSFNCHFATYRRQVRQLISSPVRVSNRPQPVTDPYLSPEISLRARSSSCPSRKLHSCSLVWGSSVLWRGTRSNKTPRNLAQYSSIHRPPQWRGFFINESGGEFAAAQAGYERPWRFAVTWSKPPGGLSAGCGNNK